MHGRPASLGWSFEFTFSTLRVKRQQSAIHELIHRTIPLFGDLMNALAESIQDDDLRFSPGLFLSGLKIHKLNGIQIDRKKCIVDRSRQLSYVSRFVPQEFVEGTQEPDIVDSEMNASPLGHDSLLTSGWVAATENTSQPYMQIYTPPSFLVQAALQFRKGVRMPNRDLPKPPALKQNAFGSAATGVKSESSRCWSRIKS